MVASRSLVVSCIDNTNFSRAVLTSKIFSSIIALLCGLPLVATTNPCKVYIIYSKIKIGNYIKMGFHAFSVFTFANLEQNADASGVIFFEP